MQVGLQDRKVTVSQVHRFWRDRRERIWSSKSATTAFPESPARKHLHFPQYLRLHGSIFGVANLESWHSQRIGAFLLAAYMPAASHEALSNSSQWPLIFRRGRPVNFGPY